jgi:chromosome segregation ATPase
MDGTLTFENVLFGITVFGAITGLWWRVEQRIDAAKNRAQMVADDFAKYQTHVAEIYVSKQGLREVRDEIMSALDKVGGNLDRINDRIDRVTDKPSSPRARRTEA